MKKKTNTLLVAGVACIGVCQPGFFLSELVFYQAREKTYVKTNPREIIFPEKAEVKEKEYELLFEKVRLRLIFDPQLDQYDLVPQARRPDSINFLSLHSNVSILFF